MVDFSVVDWAVAIVVLAVVGGLMYWLLALAPQARLMRCPEKGAITLVDVDPTSFGDANAPGLTVRNCDLWPEQKDCGRGCLARYGETPRGFGIDLHALRLFDRQ